MAEARNGHDLERKLSFYAEDAIFETVGAWTKQGKNELRKLCETDIVMSILLNELAWTVAKTESVDAEC